MLNAQTTNRFILLFATILLPILSFAQGLDQKIDQAFAPVSDFVNNVVFFPIAGTPFVLILLVGSALIFTLIFGFPNLRYFATAINVVRGKYDELDHASTDKMYGDATPGGDVFETIKDESQEGEVTHFQALATAVSGTVGNGNIAGVALAIALGGPGATFWMIICGFLGMSTKFVECTLGVKYRDVGPDGTVWWSDVLYLKRPEGKRHGGARKDRSCVLCRILYRRIIWWWQRRTIQSSDDRD